ncbi:hypothetical protein EHQ30_04210 [Leptospira brenneri]|uniref:Uncharacterized protein n=1 Tax=Leptospira brenneri TaxID=2023182 RepID=A0A5F1Z915_9LEPT|nr:hypothetical protein EHQ30_04210 [Leptospira brenneri]
MQGKIFIGLSLIFIFQCSNPLDKKPIQENYFNYLVLTTTSLPCHPQSYESPFQFNDTVGDVKAGFLNSPSDVGYLDLVNGSIYDQLDKIEFQLKVETIPDTLNANLSSVNGSPEYEWSFTFRSDHTYKIGIVHYSNGVPERMKFQNFQILVWKNEIFLGGCGNLAIQGDKIHWLCDKNTIPQLGEISQTKSIFIESKQVSQGLVYSDCH